MFSYEGKSDVVAVRLTTGRATALVFLLAVVIMDSLLTMAPVKTIKVFERNCPCIGREYVGALGGCEWCDQVNVQCC